MRICSPHCGISPSSDSGGEIYERNVLKEMALLGAEIEVILAKNKQYDQDIKGLNITELPFPRGLRWFVAPFVFPTKIYRIYKTRPFDILRIHSVRFIGPAALLARKLYHLPVPIITHHHHIDVDKYNFKLDKRVLEGSDIIITDSKFSLNQLRKELDLDVSNVKVVPAGIDEKYIVKKDDYELRGRLGLGNSVVILFIAKLIARKNIQFLLKSFAKLTSITNVEVRLIIGGKGELMPALKEQTRRLGIADKVVFLGFVPEKDKVRLYNTADIFAFPSFLEGFGLVVGEAMACGKPVVVSDRGSLPELLEDGVQGFISPITDTGEFASKLKLLAENRELRLKLGHAARLKVEKDFRWNNTARKILNIYEAAVKKIEK